MFAHVPLAFTLDLDPHAVDEQAQRAIAAAIGGVNTQRPFPHMILILLRRLHRRLSRLTGVFRCFRPGMTLSWKLSEH